MTCEKFDKLTLLSFITGDLGESDRTAVEIHLRTCTSCAGFIKDTGEERAAFLDAFPAFEGALPKRGTLLRFDPVRTAFALAAALVLVVGSGSLIVKNSPNSSRVKGEVGLKLFAQDSTGTAVVRDDPVFAPGERIQFTYSCGAQRYFILASIDGSGSISVFYPAEGDSSMLLEPGRDLPLPNSIVLDDYIGKERFYAVFSAHPLQVAAVVAAMRKGFSDDATPGPTTLPIDRATVTSILLTKQEGRR